MLALGVGLAIAQPGGLGDDDEGAATATTVDEGAPTSGETTTTGETTTSTEGTTSTTEGTSTTTVADTTTTTAAPPSTSTTVGSGVSGAEVEDDGDLADSGGEDLAIPALGLAAAGLALSRLRAASRPS